MAFRWMVLHEEWETGRKLEGLTMLEEYDLKSIPLEHKSFKWFSEAVQTVKNSIQDGFTAKLEIGRVGVYMRLRMSHFDKRGVRLRTEESRGVVVPRLLTTFFSRTGKVHPKVLYEETAHSLVRPVPNPEKPSTSQMRRYKCHLEIFEGLQVSAYFGRMQQAEQTSLRRLIQKLRPRCLVREGGTVDKPCGCTL